MIVQIGIIGAGVFGNYHAQKITLNKHARLVGFYDANIVKSTQLAKAHNCTVYPDLDDLLEQVDTVIIASPAKAHYKQRFSPYSPRGSGISVTQDLMIHDIDLAIWLMGGLPKQIKGYAHKIISSSADTSLAFLEFANGKARLDANRVAPQAGFHGGTACSRPARP